MFGLLHGSRTRSLPIFLYALDYGEGAAGQLRMTSGDYPVEFEGETYHVYQVSHGEVGVTGTLDKTTLTMRTPRTNPLVEVMRVYPPERIISLKLYQGETNEPDTGFETTFMVTWAGRILNMAFVDDEAVFTCEPVSTSMRRPGLRRTYQYGCPHVLYGGQCKANKAAASRSALVDAVSASTVTLAAGWEGPHPREKYLKGTLEWTDGDGNAISRLILQVSGTQQVLVSGPATSLTAGMSATVVLGCNRDLGDCANLHSNIVNYGGQPWIMEDSPFQSNIFY